MVHEDADVALPQPWLRAMEKPTRPRSWLVDNAYLGQRRRAAGEEITYLWHMRSWSDRALYVFGHLRMESGPDRGDCVPDQVPLVTPAAENTLSGCSCALRCDWCLSARRFLVDGQRRALVLVAGGCLRTRRRHHGRRLRAVR